MDKQIAIKPCPFCGSNITIDEYGFYMFCCDECGTGVTFAKELEDGTAVDCDKDESVAAWNLRAPLPDNKAPTRGDRIRAMSDEELAEFAVLHTKFFCTKNYGEVCEKPMSCTKCAKDWLTQPDEEESL